MKAEQEALCTKMQNEEILNLWLIKTTLLLVSIIFKTNKQTNRNA